MCKIYAVSQTFYWLVTCGVLSLIIRYLTLDHELEKIYPTLIKKKNSGITITTRSKQQQRLTILLKLRFYGSIKNLYQCSSC